MAYWWYSLRCFRRMWEVRFKVVSHFLCSFLRPKDIRTSWFYILPKLHKPGIPGRPIVSSCGAPTEKISKFIDHHLSSLVKKIPSYVKDTNDFLSKLLGVCVTSDSLLATLDVTSLHVYTNIPRHEGLHACRKALKTRGVLDPPTDDIINLIKLLLKRNNFTFNDMHYLQMRGTAMGTRMAPSWCKSVDGPIRKGFVAAGRKKTNNLVEVYRLHLRYLATRGRKPKKFYSSDQFPSQNDQVHGRVV